MLGRKKREIFFGTATVNPMVVITMGTEQWQKCYNQVFSGPPFLKMPMSSCDIAIDAKEQGESHEGMKCHYKM